MPKHLKGIYRSIVVVALILLTACSGGSGGSSSDDTDSGSASGEEQSADEGSSTPPELTLDTSSRQHAVHLAWTGADTVDIYFSTDPECDWDAYGSCPDSGLITHVEGQESLLSAPDDGLLINRSHWFVVAADDRVSDPMPGRPWVPAPDNAVSDLQLYNDVLYVGGGFQALAAQVGGVALFNEDHYLSGQMPWSSNQVNGVAPDGHGGYFYYGSFDWFMGVPRTNIAHLDEFGRLTDWSLDVDNQINDVVVVEDTVYLAAGFNSVNGEEVERLVRLNRLTGEPDLDWLVSINDNIRDMLVAHERLYVGGAFDTINGEAVDGLGAVQLSTGSLFPEWIPEISYSGVQGPRIDLIEADDFNFYIAGRFDEVGGEDHQGLVAIDVSTGELQSWGHDLHPEFTSYQNLYGAHVIELGGDVLYVGGLFEGTGHTDQNDLIALTPATGVWVDWVPPDIVDMHSIQTLQVDDEWVYVGGIQLHVAGYPGRNLVVFSNASQGSQASIRW